MIKWIAVPLLGMTVMLTTGCKPAAYYVKAGSYVKHHKPRSDGKSWNEGFNNRAVGMEIEFEGKKLSFGEVVPSVGLIQNVNSYGKDSVNLHGAVKHCTRLDEVVSLVTNSTQEKSKWRFCAGVVAGGATSYEEQTGNYVTGYAAPMGSIDYNGHGIDFTTIPSKGKITGFDAVVAKYKVSKFNLEDVPVISHILEFFGWK